MTDNDAPAPPPVGQTAVIPCADCSVPFKCLAICAKTGQRLPSTLCEADDCPTTDLCRSIGCQAIYARKSAEAEEAAGDPDITVGAPSLSPAQSSAEETPLDVNRCAICGWTLSQSPLDGCVRGSCSLRPWSSRYYDPERARVEYGPSLPPESNSYIGSQEHKTAERLKALAAEITRLQSALSTMTQERDALRDALRSLANEARGFHAMASPEAHGQTNLRCMERRIDEAYAALRTLHEEKTT